MQTLEQLGIKIPRAHLGRAKARTACPQCRRSERDHNLGVTFRPDGGGVCHCFRCGFTAPFGSRFDGTAARVRPKRTVPVARGAAPAIADTLSPQWRRFWEVCAPYPGTPVERYLRARGCAMPPADADLRFSPTAWHAIEQRALPAMVGLATDAVTAEARTLHLTFLKADGSGKAEIDRPKLLLAGHRKAGAVVRLWSDEAVTTGLAIAEGIETALATAHAYAPVWSAIDAGNLAELPVLNSVEELLIAADNDDAGNQAAEQLAARWTAAGRSVRIARSSTPGADLADEACR